MRMELNTQSLKPGDLSPPDCASDPDEKEVSDNDDDRNHKHRRRDTESQSADKDPLEQALTQPYRKRHRPFQNGQVDFQSQNNLNRDFSKRRLTGTNFTRQSGEPGFGRVRGRGGYFQRDTRFGSLEVASQMVHPGAIPPSMFTGRGLPVPNAQSASWSGFGLVPTIANGSVNAINPLGLQGLGPQMNSSMNMGMQRQRCRDFEERGFCLRGDMCPMEHGVNRIVVEDVQSLSQFNLPVSLPGAQILGPSTGIGFVSSADVSNSLINSIGPHSLTDNSSVDEEVFAGAINAGGADVYDPDQPLWNNDAHQRSTPLLGLNSSGFDESVSFVDANQSDHAVRSRGDFTGVQSTSSSIWGRLRNSKNKLEPKEKFDSRTKGRQFPAKEICEPSSVNQGIFHAGKQNNGVLFGPKSVMATSKGQIVGGTIRKSSQKAHRTLFVNCIPLQDNKRESLLSHFRKFGEVIDIYIPANSERAFVQFSKREEAEKALKAPDAVMGSRFIKLWWANKDSIADKDVSSSTSASISPHDVIAASGSHLAAISQGKNNVQHAAPEVVTLKPPGGSLTAGNDQKLGNSPKEAPPAQKKMKNLEVLKEQLRKKQEMLEQKRHEFRQQLDKLTKQTSGKIEVLAEPPEMRQVSETPSNASKGENTQPSDADISTPSPKALTADKIVMKNLASNRAKVKSAGALLDPLILKQPIHPMATSGRPSYISRYKLDNRPTTFRIRAPLPAGLTNVAVLRDHFSLYGEISNLEIDESYEEQSPNNLSDSEGTRNCSVRVSFATRSAAERAFLNGKSWHGQNLQFSWVTSTSSILVSSRSSGESSSAPRGTSNIEVQSSEKTVNDGSQDAMDPTETNLTPPKSSNELSSNSSRSNCERDSAAQKHSHPEVESPDKSTGHALLEADESENRNSEGLEEEKSGDDLKLDENLEAG